MRNKLLALAVAAALTASAGGAFADHNSKNGEGTANMPNDIHNTRVETKDNDDNEAFKDFVQYGEGATSVNRFDSDDTQPGQAGERKGSGDGKAAANQGESAPMNRNQVETKTATKDQVRTETQARTETQPAPGTQTRSETQTRPDSQPANGAKPRSMTQSRTSTSAATRSSSNMSSSRSSGGKGGRKR